MLEHHMEHYYSISLCMVLIILHRFRVKIWIVDSSYGRFFFLSRLILLYVNYMGHRTEAYNTIANSGPCLSERRPYDTVTN